jgi:hypothetical protein
VFLAYSEKKKKQTDINSEFDLSEIFYCLDETCPAEVKIRSSNGKIAKHFGVVRGLTPHKDGCFWGSNHSSYINNCNIEKSSLEVIMLGNSHCINTNTIAINSKSDNTNKNRIDSTVRINTPLSLYRFCIANHLDTPFCDGLTVNDIVVDSRNLNNKANFKGVSGIRLIVGKTSNKISSNNFNFIVTMRTINNKRLSLNLTVTTNNITNIKNHLFETYGRTFDVPIAVLGQ